MSENTSIQWADHSFSPWWGCTPVSPGCANCYASSWAKFTRGLEYRKGVPRQRTKDWSAPLRWNKAAAGLAQRPRVFPSMCDPFDIEAPIDWRVDFMGLIEKTPNLDWLLLTKRPERLSGTTFPRNVWLGVSVENQEQLMKRAQILYSIPAKVRFLSVEPLLEEIDLLRPFIAQTPNDGRLLDWLIVGGESGRGARPCHVNWIRKVVGQAKGAGVAVFVKQLGSDPRQDLSDAIPEADITRPDLDPADIAAWEHHRHNAGIWLKDKKGGCFEEWPAGLRDLQIREFPVAA